MDQYLFIKVQQSLFAINRLTITEIGRLKDFTLFPLPLSHTKCLGAIHHHGKIAIVLAGDHYLNLPVDANATADYSTSRLIFFNTPSGEIALTADLVSNDSSMLSESEQWEFIALADYL